MPPEDPILQILETFVTHFLSILHKSHCSSMQLKLIDLLLSLVTFNLFMYLSTLSISVSWWKFPATAKITFKQFVNDVMSAFPSAPALSTFLYVMIELYRISSWNYTDSTQPSRSHCRAGRHKAYTLPIFHMYITEKWAYIIYTSSPSVIVVLR